jgi:hypothetical protein
MADEIIRDREPTQRSSRDELPISPIPEDIWKIILDRQGIPENMVHMLRGEVGVPSISPSGKRYIKWEQRGDPLMNDIGIRFFTPLFYSATSPDKLVTNISDEEVNTMMKEMMMAVIYVIIERGDEFGIPPSNRSFVLLQIEHFYFMALTASRRGTILNVLKPTFKREETFTPQKVEKKSRWNPLTFLTGGT